MARRAFSRSLMCPAERILRHYVPSILKQICKGRCYSVVATEGVVGGASAVVV